MQCLATGTEPMLRSAPARAAEAGRRLSAADRGSLLRHLLALTAHDLEMRFGGALAAHALERHVERIDFATDIVLALEDAGGALLGVAQIMRLPRAVAVAEVAFSVLPSVRGQGLGTHLVKVALCAARAQGLVRIVAQVCPRNDHMLTILRREGMHFVREDGEMLGTLELVSVAQPMTRRAA